MKTLLGVLAIAVVSSARGQLLNTVTSIDRIDAPAHAPQTIAEAVGAHPRVRASVVTLDVHDTAFIIPVAGNTAGSNGTYFRSDVSIANFRSATQRFGVGWLAQGSNNASSPLQYFTIPANTVANLNDFVGATLGKTGLGGLFIEGVDAAGALDSNASMDAFSRIWTQEPTVNGITINGTVSQNFDAVSLDDSIGSLTAYIIGLKQSTAFRTNVGIVNLDTVQHTWTIRSAITGASSTVTVLPFSISQTSAPAGSADSGGNVALTLNSDGSGFNWTAYGSSSDNVTGDGWISRAKQ
ncbi:MAG: hypothetical protein M3041_11410 [Acidobacteriota bacterium]|nr:hypothetical protein [Acidobacteriota bacterium]